MFFYFEKIQVPNREEPSSRKNSKMTSSKEVLKIVEVHYAVNKMLTALEIIKEKEVDIYGIKNSIDVYDYNSGIENEDNFDKRLLTLEEYELVKEVLI